MFDLSDHCPVTVVVSACPITDAKSAHETNTALLIADIFKRLLPLFVLLPKFYFSQTRQFSPSPRVHTVWELSPIQYFTVWHLAQIKPIKAKSPYHKSQRTAVNLSPALGSVKYLQFLLGLFVPSDKTSLKMASVSRHWHTVLWQDCTYFIISLIPE